MRRLEIAAASDVGRMRTRNEDAYHAGDGVFAVADGMGGHLAGDVASATALLPVRSLDGKVFADAASAQAALLDAILAANAAVVRKAADEPTLHGMGTTLTATIVEGRRLHVGHVGDSRAYLVREGQIAQLTRDHTLVAHLIEEGQITREEAAIHPQRSIVTRAIGVDVDLDVDTLTIELHDRDEVLLCSDGLTGPVSDTAILETLTTERSIDRAVQRLIELANANGGPDNITVVLLRYHEDDPGRDGDGQTATTVIRPDADAGGRDHDWAGALGRMGAVGGRLRGHTEADEDTTGRRARRVATAVAVLLGLLALVVAVGWWLLSRSYFVGLDDRRVAVYHGVPASLGPVELAWLAETTDVGVSDVPRWKVEDLENGIAAADLADARRIVDNLRALRQERQRSRPSTARPSPAASPAP
ncbi:MAG TPA: Stp1/IreP family PP2C-type Ser/Thr phosphatase [Nitriliruptorales bacterium]|nr:Stp1/IreP family PP2C-type Ser/Thr phosphatase [Nitriliruptorales bacterium]